MPPWKRCRRRHRGRQSAGSSVRCTIRVPTDFDPKVKRIIAQPFHMTAHVDRAAHRRDLNYLLLTDGDDEVRHRAERVSDDVHAYDAPTPAQRSGQALQNLGPSRTGQAHQQLTGSTGVVRIPKACRQRRWRSRRVRWLCGTCSRRRQTRLPRFRLPGPDRKGATQAERLHAAPDR